MLRQLMMTSTFVLLSTLGMTAYAQGGFEGPSSTHPVNTVEQVQQASDGDLVVLRGHIVGYIHKDDYLFKDGTGTIRVEIEHDKWAGQVVIPENLVQIWGEVEKDWDSVQVDVDRVQVIEQSAP